MATINSINVDGTTHYLASYGNNVTYGTCATAAATVAKAVTASYFPALHVGMHVFVRFTYANTASSPTLNVNSTGAKTIYRYGTTVPGTTAGTSWAGGEVVEFVYETTSNTNGCWKMIGKGQTAVSVGTTSVGSASGWSTGTLPTLTVTSTACDDITAWSAGSASADTITNTTLYISNGTAPSLTYTARSIGSASNWSQGTLPSLTISSTSVVNSVS